MPVIHLVRHCLLSGMISVPAGTEIRPMCQFDRKGVVELTGPQQAQPLGPMPTARGIVAELPGRPGRAIEAWVAAPAFNGNPRVVGLATLVTSAAATGPRRSIAWLLVHPSARRRGIGRALVETICHEVSNRDQPEIWIECHTKWPNAVFFWRSVGFSERERGRASTGS